MNIGKDYNDLLFLCRHIATLSAIASAIEQLPANFLYLSGHIVVVIMSLKKVLAVRSVLSTSMLDPVFIRS
jgi:hypothetical protein